MFQFLQYSLLIIYSLLVSESFMYALGYGTIVKKLSATAFIEHRVAAQSISFKQSILYLAAIVNLLALLYLSCMFDLVFITNILLALCCICLDVFIAVKKQSKLNKTIASWNINNYPEEWEDIRSEWWRYFSWRMIACITGFLYFLGGMFFH
jgi:flagellar biosynthesis component FlhA